MLKSFLFAYFLFSVKEKVSFIPQKESINGPDFSPVVGVATDVFVENSLDFVDIEELFGNFTVK